MLIRKVKEENPQPDAAQGSGEKISLPPGRRTAGRYGAAHLAARFLVGILALGMVACNTTFWGAGVAIRQSPGETDRLLRNAHYYTLMGRPEVALRELEQAHQQDPDNLKIVNCLARGYEELGNLEAARQLYQEALARHGPHPVLTNNLCFTYYQEGRWPEAETCFRQSLARDPQNVAARNNLGLLYCRLGRQDEARRLWQEAEGDAAADLKMSQAHAALGISGGAAYAQRGAPSSSARPTSTPAPATTLSRPTIPLPDRVQPLHPTKPWEESARKLANQAAPPAPVSHPSHLKEAAEQGAISKKAPPAESPAPATAAAPGIRQRPLTCAELLDTAIEVRNGTRSRNLARHTRSRLSQEGFTVAKIGNHLDFGAEKTIVFYRPGAARVAQVLGRTFFPGAALEASAKLHKGMDVKILLGADLLDRPQLMTQLAGETQ